MINTSGLGIENPPLKKSMEIKREVGKKKQLRNILTHKYTLDIKKKIDATTSIFNGYDSNQPKCVCSWSFNKYISFFS